MATLKTNSYDGRYMCFDCSSEVTGPGKTKITWELYARGGNTTYYYVGPITARINGEEVYSFDGRGQQATGRKAKGSFTVTHGTNGVGKYTWSIKAAIYSTSVNCTGSGTYTLASKNYPYTSISPAENLKVAFNNGTAGTSINIPSKSTYQVYLDEKGANTTTDKQLKFTWTVAKGGTNNPVKNQILQYWYNEQWNTFATLAGDATSYTMSLADFYEKTKPVDGSGSSKGFQIMAIPSKYGTDKGSNNVYVLNYYYYSLPYDLTLEFSTIYKVSNTQTITKTNTLKLDNNTKSSASITLPQGDGTFPKQIEKRTVKLVDIKTQSSNGEINPHKVKLNNIEITVGTVSTINDTASLSIYCYNDIFSGNVLTVNITNNNTDPNIVAPVLNFSTTTATVGGLPIGCTGYVNLYYKLASDSKFSTLATASFTQLATNGVVNLDLNDGFVTNTHLFTDKSISLKIEYYYTNNIAQSAIKTMEYPNLRFYSIADGSFSSNNRNQLKVGLANNANIVGVHFDTNYLNSEYSDYITTTIDNTALKVNISKSLYGSSFLSQNGDSFTLSGKPFFFTKLASNDNIGKFQSNTVTSHTFTYIPRKNFTSLQTDPIEMFQASGGSNQNFVNGFQIPIDSTIADPTGSFIINNITLNCSTQDNNGARSLNVSGNSAALFEDYGIEFYRSNVTVPVEVILSDGGVDESYPIELSVSSIPELQVATTLLPVGNSQLTVTTNHTLSNNVLNIINGSFKINNIDYRIQFAPLESSDTKTSLEYGALNTYTIPLSINIPQILPDTTISTSGAIKFGNNSDDLTPIIFDLPIWFNPQLNIEDLRLELSNGNTLTITGQVANNTYLNHVLGYPNGNTTEFGYNLDINIDETLVELENVSLTNWKFEITVNLGQEAVTAYLKTTQHVVQFTLTTESKINAATLTTIVQQNFFDVAPPLSLRENVVGIHTKNPEQQTNCCFVVRATQEAKLIKFIISDTQAITIDLTNGSMSGATLDGGTWT